MPRPVLFLPPLLLFLFHQAAASPLSTSSRWIVDESGLRVKLACVSWASHLETMVAEGLEKQPLDVISKNIASMGFNCARLTWPLFMITNDSFASLTVNQSFHALGLDESIAAIKVNNPDLVELPLLQAYKAVVSNLGENNIMVILDNHISKPGWCCSNSDGNGFFGDKYFNPDEWISGLTKMATMFKDTPNVVGMSLRNELRGPKQNVKDWYKYMQRGAEAVHTVNQDILIILSGLSFDNDLSFLSTRPVKVSFEAKLVFELHWYAFSNGQDWANGSPNQVCGSIGASVMRRGGFLVKQGWPLFISEFGVDQRGININDNRYLGCFLGLAAELDVDWALWTLQGSYYLRQGVRGMEEFYGSLSYDWSKTRNSTFLQRISTLQSPFQGPGLSNVPSYKVIFHPATGLCVARKSLLEPLQLGSCDKAEAWDYTNQHTLQLKGTPMCLQAAGDGEKVKFGVICSGASSRWELVSDSRMHLATNLTAGSRRMVCLGVGLDESSIVTNPCRCLGDDPGCDPEEQWFRIIDSARAVEKEVSVKDWFWSLWWRGLSANLALILKGVFGMCGSKAVICMKDCYDNR